MRCRQQTRKTEGKLSNTLSTIKVIGSSFIENDSFAMQAKNPQKLKQNCIIFLYYQTTGRRGMSTPGVRVCRIRMRLVKIRKDSWTKRPTATLTG